jgi:hypothetical protein
VALLALLKAFSLEVRIIAINILPLEQVPKPASPVRETISVFDDQSGLESRISEKLDWVHVTVGCKKFEHPLYQSNLNK